MSNDIETRYLVVTLPDTSGEEAESVAELFDGELTDGFTVHGRVEHALGLVLPPNVAVTISDGVPLVRLAVNPGAPTESTATFLDAANARALAGALLRAAGETEVIHGTCTHCDRAIVQDKDGTWVDPQASGDDSMWRETCDENHGQFVANHDPVSV